MSRLDIMTPSHAQTVIDGLYRDVERRIAASPPGLCPVDLAKSFLDLCHAQTCGKCVPCRIGLGQLSELMEQVLEGEATMETISIIERVARVIVNSADCAIGRDAARLVLDGVQGFRDDYEEHILRHRCLGGMREPVPCVALCPAGVDIPGYLVLIKYGRYADAVRLIRKDNPFPSACAYICEHPCEARCRRNMIDDAVNIRGLKRYAVDNAGYVPQPDCAEPSGKKVAVIGGGNVAMDVARTAKRLGAESVTCVYRRRVDDMTALAEEIEEAMAEGCQILPLQAPARIEKDAEGKVAALWTVPQIIGPYGKDGRPKPIPADVPEFRIACDYVIVAIGQAIDARPFEAIGIKTFKGMIQAEDTSSVADVDNVFAGGDAVSGPATVIRAVAAGKVAAANIDAYLGFEHKIKTDVVVPPAHLTNAPPCGRVNLKSHCTPDCKGNFDLVVEGMSRKEADQESERCLRCDYFGFGSFRGGRTGEW